MTNKTEQEQKELRITLTPNGEINHEMIGDFTKIDLLALAAYTERIVDIEKVTHLSRSMHAMGLEIGEVVKVAFAALDKLQDITGVSLMPDAEEKKGEGECKCSKDCSSED